MKKIILLPILIMALVACEAENSSSTSTVSTISSNEINKIALHYGGGMPPPSNLVSTAIYNENTEFFPDGKVEYIATAYDSTVLISENWQISSENFQAVVDKLNEINFFSLPNGFVWGPTDLSTYALSVHTNAKVYSSTYSPNGDYSDDDTSYEILFAGVQFFKEKTAKSA